MKKITFLLVFFFASLSTFAQDVTGDWKGTLTVPGMELHLVLHITKTEKGLTSTLDSPDQQAFGIPVTITTFENGTLKFTVERLTIEYEGILSKDQKITGTFKQAGNTLPLVFNR